MNQSDIDPDTRIAQRAAEPVEPAETAIVDAGFTERYVLRDLLGRGGMGTVYRCLDLRIRREIAMKIAESAGAASHGRQRFLREARIQGQLQHPVIPALYDIGVDAHGAEFFTMKRVAGVTLEAVLRARARKDAELSTKFSRSKLLDAFRRVCRAIEFAHAVGVIHRDLKPANIMLGDFGEVYILDWGVAKVIEPEGGPPRPGQTMAGQMLGTPGYAAPEQLISALAADERSDIYSLGAILFEILTQEPLHQEPTETERVRSTQIGVVGATLYERLKNDDIPIEMHGICVRATALNPDHRYPSVGALLDDLENVLDQDADQERLRSLAARHVEAAASIAAKVEASPDDEPDRARALQEIGSALALDPHSENAGRVLRKLLSATPQRLPDEAEAALEAAQVDGALAAARSGIVMYSANLLLAVLVIWAGVRSWSGLALIVVPLLTAIALCVYMVTRSLARPHLLLAVFIASMVSVLFTSGLFGAMILVPAMATVNLLAFNRAMMQRYRLPMLIGACAVVLLPTIAGWLGLIEPSYDFSEGRFRILPNIANLPELQTRLGLIFAGVVTFVAPVFVLWPAQDAAARARQRVHLQLWQVSRLIPEHMNVINRAGPSGAPRP